MGRRRARCQAPLRLACRPLMGGLLFLGVGSAVSMAQAEETLKHGKQIFLEEAEPRCAACHTLADAGAKGTVGPSLDDIRPSYEKVAEAVRNGIEAMPAFGDQLNEDQIKAVAEYVSTVAGQAR